MLHALSQPVHSQNSSSIYSHKLRLRPHRCQYPTLASTPTSNQDPVHGRVLSVASCTRNFCSHLERTTSRNGVWETSRRSVLSNDCPRRRTAMAAMGLEGRVQRENGEAITEIRATVNRTERGQRLRALNWVKQVRNELTSAEFALNLDAPAGPINGAPALAASEAEGVGAAANEDRSEGDDGGGKYAGTGSAIDFDGIAEGLESRLRTLQAGRPSSFLESIPEVEVKELTERLKTNLAAVKRASHQGGRGAVGGGGGSASGSAAGGGVVSGVAGNINVNLKDVKVPEFDVRLFVREDGTVDWDGAIQSGREVARFGQELWDRINGQNPHDEGGARGAGHGAGDKAPRELPEDSPVMVSLNAFGSVLEERELQLQKELDALKAESRAREVSWKTGSERREAQRAIRDKETEVARARRELQLHRIDVDMERICYLIEQDIRESTGTGGASAENRLLVAEFGLLDSQLVNLKRLASDMEGSGNGDASDDAGEGVPVAGLVSVTLVDEDELELISREVQDLKNRLGMDLENLALNMDPEKVARYVRETYDKIRSGIDFYWTGTKILGNDVGYALSLVSKAAQGSILKPREVRTLRRTGKDCLTFIPFLIILILPLTPVGHVVVFSLIQRLFPDFFPSSYTDRRQNLLKMYTEVEKKVDWDDSYPSPGGDDMLEKLRRNFSSTLNPLGDQEERNKEKDR